MEVEGVSLMLNKTGTNVCRRSDQGMRPDSDVGAMEISIWADITADKGKRRFKG